MDDNLIQAGKVVNTHGVKGEVKIQPWTDSPNTLLDIKTFYIEGKGFTINGIRVHKNSVLVSFDGVDDVVEAMSLKNKVVYIPRSDIPLEDGQVFLSDLMGLEVIDTDSQSVIGKIVDVLQLPSNDVYVVKGEYDYMIPVVREFVDELNIGAGFVKVRLIEGMRTDEN